MGMRKSAGRGARLSRRRLLGYSVATTAALAAGGLALGGCAPGGDPPPIPVPTATPTSQAVPTAALAAIATPGSTATPVSTPIPATTPTPASVQRIPENVRASNDQFTEHAEPCLAANPRDPANLLGVCMAPSSNVATYASFDGGATWQSGTVLTLPDAFFMSDPTVAFDGAGRGFVCASAEVRGERRVRGIYVWRTDDGGRSFGDPTTVMEGHEDHPWLTADRSPGAASSHLHVVWSGNNLTQLGYARSTDGGRTFEPVRLITAPEEIVIAGAMVTAGANGLVGAIFEASPPSAYGPIGAKGAQRGEIVGPIRVVCSTDHGQTFGTPVELGQGATEVAVPGGDVNMLALPTIAADPQRDAIFAAFVTHQPDSPRTDIMVAASRDRGRTWSEVTPITPGGGEIIYGQPQLAVAEDGRVALSAFALAQNRIDVVLFVAEPGTLRFGPPIRVSSDPFDPTLGTPSGGPKHGAWWIGDYQGLASTRDAFHPFWNDARTGQLELFTARVGMRV